MWMSKTFERRKESRIFEDTKREGSRRMVKLQNWVVAVIRRFKESDREVRSIIVNSIWFVEEV
jgi:hypothetical protein